MATSTSNVMELRMWPLAEAFLSCDWRCLDQKSLHSQWLETKIFVSRLLKHKRETTPISILDSQTCEYRLGMDSITYWSLTECIYYIPKKLPNSSIFCQSSARPKSLKCYSSILSGQLFLDDRKHGKTSDFHACDTIVIYLLSNELFGQSGVVWNTLIKAVYEYMDVALPKAWWRGISIHTQGKGLSSDNKASYLPWGVCPKVIN